MSDSPVSESDSCIPRGVGGCDDTQVSNHGPTNHAVNTGLLYWYHDRQIGETFLGQEIISLPSHHALTKIILPSAKEKVILEYVAAAYDELCPFEADSNTDSW